MPRVIDLEVTSPVQGLHFEVPSTFIPPESSPNMQNVRLAQGIIQPAPGYDNFGSLNTVLGTPLAFPQYVENDGDTHLLCITTKYVYEFNTSLLNWGNVVSRQKILSECDTAWTASANVTATNDATIKVNGTSSTKLAIAAAFTTGLAGYINFAAVNTTTTSYIHFWVRSSIVTTAGQLRIAIDDTNASVSPLTYYNIPALVANTWTQVEVAIGSGSNAAVLSVGLDVTVDVGASGADIYLDRIIAADRMTGTVDNRISYDTYLDMHYYTNGVDPIQVKDHSGQYDDWAEAVTATYKCKTLVAFKNHLNMGSMIEGGVEYPQRFRWTNSAAATFLGTAGSTETEGEDEIMQLRRLGTKLAIYKADSIVNVTFIGGSTVYRFDGTIKRTGVLAQDLALEVGELHIFVASDNIYYYGGGSDPVPIGGPIRDELFRLLNDVYIGRSFSYYSPEEQEAYFFIPSDNATSANYCWVYNTVLNVWSRKIKTGMTAIGAYNTVAALTFGDAVGTFAAQTTSFGDRSFSSTAPIILYGTTDLLIGQIDETSVDDLSAAIDKIFDTPDFSAARLPIKADQAVRYTDNTKRWLRFAFEATGSTVDILFSRDEGNSFSTVRTVTLTSTYKRYFVSIDVPADRIRFRFRNNVVGGAFYVRWYSVSVIGQSEV